MLLKTAEIEGYRSLREVTVPFEGLTTCIGPNGSGKSSLLGALEVFFDPVAAVDPRDYWCGKGEPVEEIAIRLTFCDLTDDEGDRFRPYLSDDGRLTVERRFEQGGTARYLGWRKAISEFTTIRMLASAHRDKFNDVVDSGEFDELERATSKEDALAKMRAWETAHPDRCEILKVEFEGIETLLDNVNFISVKAFENPADHVEAQGKGAIGKLLAKMVDHRAVQGELEDFAREATERSQDLLRKASDGFQPFADAMRNQLRQFAPGFNVKVDWTPPTLQGAKPRLEVTIEAEDGLERPLAYQGHGVQRALMYAALTAQIEADTDLQRDRVLLVIEEPEAFQHPLSCRVLSATLRELSERHYQVIYSTHSPLFIHPTLVGGLRIFRREDRTGDGARTHVESLDEESLLKEWQRVFEVGEATTTSVRTRLEQHLSAQVLEGLFARVCILVEGQEDEAVVRAAALSGSLDLDSAGIGVVQTQGKEAMPNVSTFLSLAGVEVYPIFDLDRQKKERDQKRQAERQIMRSLDIDAEPVPGVGERYAAWEQNLTMQLEAELGDVYQQALDQAAGTHGYAPSQGQKIPAVVAELLERASKLGAESESVAKLSNRMAQLMESVSRSDAEPPANWYFSAFEGG